MHSAIFAQMKLYGTNDEPAHKKHFAQSNLCIKSFLKICVDIGAEKVYIEVVEYSNHMTGVLSK